MLFLIISIHFGYKIDSNNISHNNSFHLDSLMNIFNQSNNWSFIS
jgi:hypothetical protein